MAVKVEIAPRFGDENMEGEYDDGAFMQADMNLQSAVGEFIAAGGRVENLEGAIENALADAGVK